MNSILGHGQDKDHAFFIPKLNTKCASIIKQIVLVVVDECMLVIHCVFSWVCFFKYHTGCLHIRLNRGLMT